MTLARFDKLPFGATLFETSGMQFAMMGSLHLTLFKDVGEPDADKTWKRKVIKDVFKTAVGSEKYEENPISYDRGHLIPASHFSLLKPCTYHVLNQAPQNCNLNQRGWKDLEDQDRGERVLVILHNGDCSPLHMGGNGFAFCIPSFWCRYQVFDNLPCYGKGVCVDGAGTKMTTADEQQQEIAATVFGTLNTFVPRFMGSTTDTYVEPQAPPTLKRKKTTMNCQSLPDLQAEEVEDE